MDKSGSFDKNYCVDSCSSTSHSNSIKSINTQISCSLKLEKDGQLKQEQQHPLPNTVPSKIPHKFIANWRQACDRTKDRTKELLKRWKTLPEFEANALITPPNHHLNDEITKQQQRDDHSEWSVHVWTTWVDRFSMHSAKNGNDDVVDDDNDDDDDDSVTIQLTLVQREKFTYFFSQLLDHDHDNIISSKDFETLSEKLRHFADWSMNSTEYHVLREVQKGFIETFFGKREDNGNLEIHDGGNNLSLELWLYHWSRLIYGARKLTDFPLWLQYFVKLLFQAMNRSGTGIISRDELCIFYLSVLGLSAIKVEEMLDYAYMSMTSNGDHHLTFYAYKLCFANYLMARYPNGPGQFVLGMERTNTQVLFPVDYSALNTSPSDLEHYCITDRNTNRHSVIV